jgi:RimJ/RimL family protein N-acetyltransferase
VASVIEEGCSFETARLQVGDWHVLSSLPSGGSRLPEIVRRFLTPSVTEQLPPSWEGPYSEQRAGTWIRDRDAEGTQSLAISRESSSPIGLLLLHEAPHGASGRLELRIGYLIAETEWGKGYASEILKGLIEWADGGAFSALVAGVAADNAPSIRVLEKCGFVLDEGSSGGTELCFTIDLTRVRSQSPSTT